ncbi:MAG TPA: hypothetical protein VEB19_13235 [Gemmatimonadaceae bacterium]|nr:hypothetical protein [Gemmatimonadaceae bacterium]
MKRLLLALVFLLATNGSPAEAQQLSSIAARPVEGERAALNPRLSSADSSRGELPIRLVSAGIGAVIGLYGAAATWSIMGCAADVSCGTSGAAVIGVLAGSSILAALPARGSTCGFTKRLLLALPLSTAGALAGAMAPSKSGDVVFTIPLGAAIGAAAGASFC